MSTERDELARDIPTWQDLPFGGRNDHVKLDANAAHAIAGVLIEKGWTKPRTVTTAEELDALPEGSLLLASGTYYGMGEFTDCHCRILPSFIHGEDRTVVEVLIYGGSELAKSITFPATVLHVGGER